jgi:hypothetical protein
MQVYGVRVRPSTIPNTGKGLFATRDFLSNSWICPYLGEVISQQYLDQRYVGDVTAAYAVQDGVNFIDSACRRGIAAMANGLFRNDGHARSVNQHNAIIEQRPGQGVWLRAPINISDGDEIFVWYGDDYRLEDDHETVKRRGVDTRPC